MPPGTEGRFVLLYVPLGEVTPDEVKGDFRAVAEGLKAMFTEYGFGAKTSSGFGRAEGHWERAEIRPEKQELREEWKRVWSEGGGETHE
ncbi:MAG: hypothetical protein KatS3mg131_1994 [Candidatus Tectimicrobiota bacterium]|nr:MAG: hypothetical protein KatS3mg131_1994 [Candidatus Tectomicrobia bacterium]